MFFNFFVYKTRYKKKRLILKDFKQFMNWNRCIARRNKNYNRMFLKLEIQIDPG